VPPFRHQADENSHVVNLLLEGDTEPTGVTDNHPYWSVDRSTFVPAGELRTGERVNTEFGRFAHGVTYAPVVSRLPFQDLRVLLVWRLP
jgi:hypothetical protein